MAQAAVLPLIAVLLLWSVFIVERALGLDLYRFGLLPRDARGLLGIITSPFIHGDAEHLFNNSVPLLLLGWGLMYFYPRIAGRVVLASWLISGVWVWISARDNYHIGASGVVYGLAAFLFFSGVIRRQRTLMALSLIVVFLYGSLVWGVFPLVPRVSWESHLWGGVAGSLMAYLYRKVPPAVQDPVRPLDDDDDDDDDDEGAPEARIDRPQRTTPLRVVYHLDPGDEVDEEEQAWRRDLSKRGKEIDPESMSDTWFDDEEPRY